MKNERRNREDTDDDDNDLDALDNDLARVLAALDNGLTLSEALEED